MIAEPVTQTRARATRTRLPAKAANGDRADLPHVELAQPGDEPAATAATELADRAEISNGTSLIALSKTEADLAQLAADHAHMVYDVADPAALESMRKFRMRCSAMRTTLKANCLALREPARDFASKVLEAERAIAAKILEIEAVGDKLLTDYDQKVKDERQRKVDEAAAALKKIDDAIESIRARPNLLMGKPSSEILAAVDVVDAIEVTEEEFGKKAGDALMVKMSTLETLRAMHGNALAMEEQQRVLAEDQAKLKKANDAQNALNAIQGMAMRALGQPAAVIAELLAEVEAIDVMADVFGDRDTEALTARDSVRSTLRQLHAAAVSAEALAAQQKAQQDALDARAQEQRDRQAVLDKAEADRLAALEAEATAKRQHAMAIEARIDRMREMPDRLEATDACAAVVESALRTLNDTLVTIADFGDRQAEAEQVRQQTMEALRTLHAAVTKHEDEQAELARQQQEERDREAAAATLARKVREVSSAMHDCLRQWAAAEARQDEAEMANARASRDALLTALEA